MLLTRIEKIGDSAALLLTDEMLKLLNIGFGDEVEVSADTDRTLVVRSLNESERKRLIEKATGNVFRRRESVYKRLAEGVSEE
jgi:antitoxin component of MazEF toxin-antitoxin module